MPIYSRQRGLIGFLSLLGSSFQTYWVSNEDSLTDVQRNKNILAIIITISGFLGIAMTASGLTNLHGYRLEYDFTPVTRQARQNYLLLTIVGVLYIFAAIFGYFGVCERKDIFAKVYMMVCITFGLGLFLLYFIWLILDAILTPDYEVIEGRIKKLEVKPHEARIARYYMTFLLFSAILQICCGILTFLVLYKYRKIRGYISIDETEADFDILLEILRGRRSGFIE